jgi:hypothetical protein
MSVGHRSAEGKIVQQAVVTILNQIDEVDFKGFSYGFRPGRSETVPQCVPHWVPYTPKHLRQSGARVCLCR